MEWKRQIMKAMTLAVMLIGIIAEKTFAEKIVQPATNAEGYNIGKYLSAYQDSTESMTIDQVADLDERLFKELNADIPNWGWSKSTIWLRFTIQNVHKHLEHVYIESDYPFVNQLVLYEPTGSTYAEHKSGNDFKFSERLIKNRNPLFEVILEPGERRTLYLKAVSDGKTLILPLKVWDKDVFIQRDRNTQITFGIYYGLILIIIVVNLFFYITTRDRTYILYVLYTLSFGLIQASYDGSSFQYLWPSASWFHNRSIPIFGWLATLCVVSFTQHFINTKVYYPRWDKIMNQFIRGLLPFIIPLFLAAPYFVYGTIIVNLFAVLGFGPVTVVAIKAVRDKLSASNYFLLGFVSLQGGLIVFTLANLGLLSNEFLVTYGMKIGSAIEAVALSFSLAVRFKDMKDAKEQAQLERLEKLQEMNRLKDEMNTELEAKVAQRTKELRKKNKDITDSINYASRIQESILTSEDEFDRLLPEAFLFFQPKDIVSGDFYWVAEKGGKTIFTAADCTGHGVPGALMSMIGVSLLRETVNEKSVLQPSEILNQLREGVVQALKQTGRAKDSKDGMDMALCSLDQKTKLLEYSGANNSLYILRKGADEIEQIKADKQPVGYFAGKAKPFSHHEIQLAEGDRIFLFSDGLPDQFGGELNKKFGYKRFRNLLVEHRNEEIGKTKMAIHDALKEWIDDGQDEQIDDVCIIGVRI